MKIQLSFILICSLGIQGMAQSVSIEPGKSTFDNSTIGTEIKVEYTRPLKISSEEHQTPIDFYNYSQLHGRLRTSYGNMQIIGNNGVSFHPTLDSTIGPKAYLNPEGHFTLTDNAYNGFYRFNVAANDENVAYFGNINGDATVSLNNRTFLNSKSYLFKITSNSDIDIESTSSGTFRFRADNKNRLYIDGVNGNVGIGVTNIPTAKLDVEGKIRSSNLAFNTSILSEHRPVFADRNGQLSIGSFSSQYTSYNFSHVQAQNSTDELRRGSGYAWFNTTNTPATMYLPINLPNNVQVTNVKIYVYDNSASDISFTFSRNSHITNSFETIATATSSGTNNGIHIIDKNIFDHTISNLDYSYYLNISSVGNWTGNTLRFHSLVITYKHL